MAIDDKIFEDFFSHLPGACQIKGQRHMAMCSLCGISGFTDEMAIDETWGWIHPACVKDQREMTRQEENWEALMGTTEFFNNGGKE